jgi:hypothetical protein
MDTNENDIVIDKKGRTYIAYEKMKKIWAGTTLGAFARRWIGESRSVSIQRHKTEK